MEVKEFIEKLDEIQYGSVYFDENKLQTEIYEFARQINDINNLLSIACKAIMLPFSFEDSGKDIARNIVDLSIEIAVKEKNIDSLEKIVFELEYSLEMDDLAEEVREIINSL